jgi:hypothetical protein
MWNVLKRILNPDLVHWVNGCIEDIKDYFYIIKSDEQLDLGIHPEHDAYREPNEDETLWRLERMGIDKHDYYKKEWIWDSRKHWIWDEGYPDEDDE